MARPAAGFIPLRVAHLFSFSAPAAMVYADQQQYLDERSTGMTSHVADHHRAYLERSLGAHAAYTLHYHLVWSVRARRPLLQDAVARALRDHLLETSARADIHLLALPIAPEHVHVLLSLRPDMAVAAAVQRLKGASSCHLRQTFPHLRELHQDALWNTGYFVRSLGDVSVAQAKAYLDRQRAHHGV